MNKRVYFSEFLKVLKRNLNKNYFVFENADQTLEFYTKKCGFKTVVLNMGEIYLVGEFCRKNNIEFVSYCRGLK